MKDNDETTHRIQVRFENDDANDPGGPSTSPRDATSSPLDEEPQIVADGEEGDEPVVISIGDDVGDPPSLHDAGAARVPREQYQAMAREKMRLDGELRKLQGEMYQLRAAARTAEAQLADATTRLEARDRDVVAANDAAVRAQAEFQNYRRRIDRERRDAERYAHRDLLEMLLPVLDNFERALSVEPTPENLNDFFKGIELIRKQLVDTLHSFDLKPLETVGRPFDPNFHESVMRSDSTALPPDHVLREHRKGYTHKDRLLRVAMVEVTTGDGASTVTPGTAADDVDSKDADAS